MFPTLLFLHTCRCTTAACMYMCACTHTRASRHPIDCLSSVNATVSHLNVSIEWERKAEREQHLARLRHLTVMIDADEYNGGCTTADALAAGVPVITTNGELPTSRMGSAYLLSAGMEAGISRDEEGVRERATGMVADRGKKREERAADVCATPLFDPSAWVQYLARLLRLLVDIEQQTGSNKYNVVGVK
mmetsp:Transcript_48098/g.125065  ORF Transcript_48098/g.125065 Transcript_48098/m.125065 type:complete len:190 (+) Transcript_48098:1266-1835(+)